MEKQSLRTFFVVNLVILVKLQNLSVMKQKNIHSKSNGKGKYTIHRWLLTKYMHLGLWWTEYMYTCPSATNHECFGWIKHLSMKYTSSKYIFFSFFDCEIYLACPRSDIVGVTKNASVNYVEYLSLCGIFVIM